VPFTSLDGIYPAIVTPLTGEDKIATEVAEKLAARLFSAGVDGIYAAGSTGEGTRLTVENRKLLVEALMKNLPTEKKLIVHVGANNPEDAFRLADHAAQVGAHAVSSLPPRGSFGDVLNYYERLANQSSLPLIVYYFPEACPDAFTRPEELIQVAAIENVVGIKFTDYNLFLLAQLRKSKTVFNGRDEVLAAGLLMGASGGIGSTYNLLPELYVALYRHALRREWEQAAQVQRILNEAIAVLIKYPFISALKAVLAEQGFDCGRALNGQDFESDAQRRQFLAEFNRALPDQGHKAGHAN
jgi:N-acetylneuraminate lyase